jgi:hypothetical protein
MNRTNFEHAAYALLMILPFGLLGEWIAGAAFGAAFFLGREHAQAEYRWIKTFGDGKRSNMPAWGGFDPRVWRGEHDALLDWIVPVVAVVATAWALS